MAITLNGSGLFRYEQRLGDPDPFRNFLEARFWIVSLLSRIQPENRWPELLGEKRRSYALSRYFAETGDSQGSIEETRKVARQQEFGLFPRQLVLRLNCPC